MEPLARKEARNPSPTFSSVKALYDEVGTDTHLNAEEVVSTNPCGCNKLANGRRELEPTGWIREFDKRSDTPESGERKRPISLELTCGSADNGVCVICPT